MTVSKTILFFGNERLATGISTDTPIIKALVSNGYSVAAIITTPARVTHASRKPRSFEIAAFAASQDIPILELAGLKMAVDQLKEYGAAIGVLAAYGKMVPQSLIDIFRFGIVNVHPSLLPLHRGSAPIESTILDGDQQTGVSLMQLVSEMDAGPLFDQVAVQLHGNEDKQQLADQLNTLGAERLIKILPDILAGRIKPLAQSGPVTYDKRLEAAFSRLDANKPAVTLEREIRAYKGWPRSRSEINSQPVIVTGAHVVKESFAKPGSFKAVNGELILATIEGTLVIDRLIPSGSKEMSGSQYLLGRPL